MKMFNIVIFGPPGVGKGTQGKLISEKYNLIHTSTGDIFRKNMKEETPLGIEAKKYIEKGDLVPDKITIGMLKDFVLDNKNNGKKGFLFDGFPRTLHQAKELDLFLDKLNIPVKATLSLEAKDEILIERLLERGKVSGRKDDSNREIIENRIVEYNEKTSCLIDFYKQQDKIIAINGVGDIDEINDSICIELEKIHK